MRCIQVFAGGGWVSNCGPHCTVTNFLAEIFRASRGETTGAAVYECEDQRRRHQQRRRCHSLSKHRRGRLGAVYDAEAALRLSRRRCHARRLHDHARESLALPVLPLPQVPRARHDAARAPARCALPPLHALHVLLRTPIAEYAAPHLASRVYSRLCVSAGYSPSTESPFAELPCAVCGAPASGYATLHPLTNA